MLIEFSVSNFRSFREKQTFSMAASTRIRQKRESNTFDLGIPGERLPSLLKLAAVYGPNASGKSNLVKALNIFSEFAKLSPSAGDDALPVSPFRFDPALKGEPSCFEVHFVEEGQRYQFDLQATQDRIVLERLIAYPNGKETLLYERKFVVDHDEYVFGGGLEGGKELHNTWRKLTNPRVLFISQAVANSNEELQQLRRPFQWLRSGVSALGQSSRMHSLFSAVRAIAVEYPDVTNDISFFMQGLDVPITSIRFDQDESKPMPKLRDSEPTVESVRAWSESTARTKLTHKTALGEAEFDYPDESDGTKALLGFWLPWSFIQHEKKSFYRVLVIDELDSSLHPEIVSALIKRHLSFESPPQIIFTTHDTHLMNTKLLRRDQFWLTERDLNGATQLRSIHDFSGREGEDVEKRYFEGRYRSLPILRKG